MYRCAACEEVPVSSQVSTALTNKRPLEGGEKTKPKRKRPEILSGLTLKKVNKNVKTCRGCEKSFHFDEQLFQATLAIQIGEKHTFFNKHTSKLAESVRNFSYHLDIACIIKKYPGFYGFIALDDSLVLSKADQTALASRGFTI